MLTAKKARIALIMLWSISSAGAVEQPAAGETKASPAASGDSSKRADVRYEEMLTRMQTAIEDIAELYGNPSFLQVFTNDQEKAAALKQRLRSAGTADAIRKELLDLQKKKEDLLNDIALKEREAARLSERLARQRVALDALAGAIEQARTAVEDTTK